MTNDTVIECKGLAKQYQDNGLSVDVLRDIHFSVKRGERLAIIGPSGSGKSTLLHCLGGLDTPSAGSVNLLNQALHTMSEAKRCELRNRYLGFVYQFHHLLPEFTALENTAMPLLIQGAPVKSAQAKAADLLNSIGLSERHAHRLSQLSGGERQRVAIARAMVTQPACILADEPTGNLDAQTAQTVMQAMLELNQARKTSVLIVTHDLNLAKQMDSIYELRDGHLQML